MSITSSLLDAPLEYAPVDSSRGPDDVVVVGRGCKFPGADNIEEFWRVLVNGENHVTEIPPDRFNVEAFYDKDVDAPGTFYNRHAGLLKDHDAWDNRFFGISDTEAERVDPQHRYVMECTHMALEDAGITRQQISGTRTGVYIGAMNDDYKQLVSLDSAADLNSYSSTGMSSTLISNKISYLYNLQGPSLTLDTACSSSMYALHLGCQAIITDECEMAICGGVNSIINPDTNKALCKARMMSIVGQCQAFCDSADGYVRSEGCGIVVLMRRQKAEAGKHCIWGTIKTGCNQDGRAATPITAPSGVQQKKLLEHVYTRHNINPADVQYIEAHGTGTPKGDPIEANALGQFFSKASHVQWAHDSLLPSSGHSGKIPIGSVKSNIGHTESAAGIAGLLKLLLMMSHGKIVPSLHVKKDKSNVNPEISLEKYNLDIAVDITAWPPNARGERIACANSYGFGGSNSHVVVIQHQDDARQQSLIYNRHQEMTGLYPISISGIGRPSLKRNLKALHEDVVSGWINLEDISYTSMCRRERYLYRTLMFVDSINDLRHKINDEIGQLENVKPERKINMVFVCCGVGTTWTGMCNEMMAVRSFQQKIIEIDMYLEPRTGWKIGDMFQGKDTDYGDPYRNHIAIFAVQVGLAAVWMESGLKPDTIVGQSVGEVAASHISGRLPLDEAVRIIEIRSRILATQRNGTMMVVMGLPMNKVQALCAEYRTISIAVFSSPIAFTLSGDVGEMWNLHDRLQGKDYEQMDVMIRKLSVECAYHSQFVEPCTTRMREEIGVIGESWAPGGQQYNIISTVTGNVATAGDYVTGNYWARNTREPVMFYQALEKAMTPDAHNVFLEIGPRPVLKVHFPNIIKDKHSAATCLASLNKDNEIPCMQKTAKALFQMGCNISPTFREHSGHLVGLPKYHFDKIKRLYIPDKSKRYIYGQGTTNDSTHQFIEQIPSSGQSLFKMIINPTTTPFVYEHTLSGDCLAPGATFVEAGLHIGSVCLSKPANMLRVSVEFKSTLSPKFKENAEIEVTTHAKPNGNVYFKCFDGDVVFSSGTIEAREARNDFSKAQTQFNIEEICGRCMTRRNQNASYACLEEYNFQYGQSLRLIDRSWSSEYECVARLMVPETICQELTKTKLHPAVLDSVFQTLGVLEGSKADKSESQNFILPTCARGVKLNGFISETMYSYAKLKQIDACNRHYQVFLLDESGNIIAEVENFTTKAISEQVPKEVLRYASDYADFTISSHQSGPSRRVVVLDDLNLPNWFAKFTEKHSFAKVQTTRSVDMKDTFVYCCPQNLVFPSEDQLDVLEKAVVRFQHIKDIVLSLSNMGFTGKLCVITQNTQAHPNTTESECQTSLLGSELWGMIRSIRHEDLLPDICLIDVDENDFEQEKLAMILSCETDIRNGEIIASGSELYHTKIIPVRQKCLEQREIGMSGHKPATLYTSSSDGITKPYFRLGKSTVSHAANRHVTQVVLTSIVNHDRSVFCVGQSIDSPTEMLMDDYDEGLQVIVLEGTGKMVTNGLQEDVVFCYPTHLSTPFVSIPNICTIPLKDINYKPGKLILTCVLYSMIKFVPTGSRALLIGNDNNAFASTRQLLQMRECSSTARSFDDLMSMSEDTTETCSTVVVLASHLEKKTLSKILQVGQKCMAETIVVLRKAITEETETLVKLRYPNICLKTVDTMQIFQPKFLSQIFPKVKCLLQEEDSRTALLRDGHTLFMLYPMVNSIISPEAIPCKVGKADLFHANGCYIVVGGLTGLGRLLVRLLAKHGAGFIAIFSRTKPSRMKLEEIRNLENNSNTENNTKCCIHHFQVDICSIDSVKRGFNDLSHQCGSISVRGIFNGAGVIRDELLQNQTEETMRCAMSPKLQGSWNLHLCSEGMPLDYFVMHSSVVGLIGNAGQTNYAAGNSFLDSLAIYRRQFGIPGQSIQWGALDVGMANNDFVRMNLEDQGMGLLSEEEIGDCFIEALMCNEPQMCFAKIDWVQMSKTEATRGQNLRFKDVKKINFQRSLSQMSSDLFEDDREDCIVAEISHDETVRETIENKLCEQFVADRNTLSDAMTFTSLGVDSLSAMNLKKFLKDKLNVEVPVPRLLKGTTTVGEIIQFCIEKGETQRTSTKVLSEKHNKKRNRPTPMQDIILKDYFVDASDPTLMYMVDIESEHSGLTIKQWQQIFVSVLAKHPQLRTTFSKTPSKQFRTSVHESHNIKLQLEELQYDRMRAKVNNETDQRDSVTFNLGKEHPIKFQIGLNKTQVLLRVAVHKVVGDLLSVFIICRDIKLLAENLQAGTEIDISHQAIDLGPVIHRAFNEGIEKMYIYWNRRMQTLVKPTSMGDVTMPLHASDHRVVPKQLDSKLLQWINYYCRSTGLTMFHMFASAYQLLLRFVTGSRCVAITTDVDMRQFIPELKGQVTRSVNVIPLIAEINDSMTVKDFLDQNRIDIVEALEHCLFPFSEIAAIAKAVSPALDEQLSRHYLIMNDRSEVNRLQNVHGTGSKTNIRNIWISRKNKETVTFVNYDLYLSTATVEFGYNERVCAPWNNSHLVDMLFTLLDKMVHFDGMTIGDLGRSVVFKF